MITNKLIRIRDLGFYKKINFCFTKKFIDHVAFIFFSILACFLIFKIYQNQYLGIQNKHPEWTNDAVLLKYLDGDLQYLPFAYSLSRLNFGEFQVFDSTGELFVPFPLASSLPIALILGIFKQNGWFLVKPIVVMCYLFAANFFFSAITNRATLSLIFAIAFIFGFLDPIFSNHLMGLPENITQAINTRIPRPFVTSLYELLFFGFLLRAIRVYKSSNLTYVFLAAILAILIQGQIYTGFILSILILFLIFNRCIKFSIKNAITFILTFIFVLSPMIFQRILYNTEMSYRFGLEIVSRDFFIDRLINGSQLKYIFYIFLATVISWFLNRLIASDRLRFIYNQAIVIILLLVIPIVSLNLFGIITGRMIQGYHFGEAITSLKPFATFFSITIMISMLSVAFDKLSCTHLKFLTNSFLITCICSCLIISMLIHANKSINKYSHKGGVTGWHNRADADDYKELGKDYQSAFSELTKFISSKPEYLQGILLTFDHQVQSWWMIAGKNRYLYLPDVFMSTLERSEIETRFSAACRFLGLNPQQCIDLINSSNSNYESFGSNNSINNFFFSHAFYHANSAFSNPKLSYSPAEKGKFNQIPIEHSWFLLIPESEIARLKYKFSQDSDIYRDPNLVVLFSKGRMNYIINKFLNNGRGNDYNLVYQNDIFNVYQKKAN